MEPNLIPGKLSKQKSLPNHYLSHDFQVTKLIIINHKN